MVRPTGKSPETNALLITAHWWLARVISIKVVPKVLSHSVIFAWSRDIDEKWCCASSSLVCESSSITVSSSKSETLILGTDHIKTITLSAVVSWGDHQTEYTRNYQVKYLTIGSEESPLRPPHKLLEPDVLCICRVHAIASEMQT